jgi:hypothetical protein
MKDDDEYKVIVKHLDLMQKEVLELRERKASNINQTDHVCSSGSKL